IVRRVGLSRNAGHRLDQFSYAIDAPVPLGIEFLLVDFQPRLKRSETSDDFLFTDFHGPAHSSFARTAVQQSRLNQVFATQEKAAALGAAESFSTRKAVEINS